jgi:hypothetical protein
MVFENETPPDGAPPQAEKCGTEKSPGLLAGLIFLPAIFLLPAAHSLVKFIGKNKLVLIR